MTYNFELQSNGGVSEKQNSVFIRVYFRSGMVQVVDSDTFEIIDSAGGRHQFELNLKTMSGTISNVFQIEGETITGTVNDIAQQLSTVFPNATSTGGGGGSEITSLDQVPQGAISKKLTASEYQFLKDLIASTST